MKQLRTALSILLPITLCLGLLGTIYFTLLDWEWIAFLSGVFFAAVLSLTSRASNAEWRIIRRTRQLAKLKEKLASQSARHHHSDQHGRDLQGRLDLLAAAVPAQILYLDTDQICRAHNPAVERSLGLSANEIDGESLRKILGDASYACAKNAVEAALKGEEVQLRQLHKNEQGMELTFDARYIPHRGSDGATLGFYAVLTSASGQANTMTSLVPAGSTPPAAGMQDDLLFSLAGLDPTGELEPQQPVAAPNPDDKASRVRTFLEALQADQFCMFQQPIVPLGDSRNVPSRHEILVRLRDEEKNLIHPGGFLDIAADLGLLAALDRWVVEHVMRWYGTQQPAAASARTSFHINLSSDSVRDELFPAFLRKQLGMHEVAPGTLCFEVAEADIIAHRTAVHCCAHALRMLGCRIAVDGFGRTSRSFADLRDMPMDFLKIDGSIIGRVAIDPLSHAKAKAITKVAHSLGAKTIAECVEDVITLEMLRRAGVDYAQGFGIAMPEPIESLESRDGGVARDLRRA